MIMKFIFRCFFKHNFFYFVHMPLTVCAQHVCICVSICVCVYIYRCVCMHRLVGFLIYLNTPISGTYFSLRAFRTPPAALPDVPFPYPFPAPDPTTRTIF